MREIANEAAFRGVKAALLAAVVCAAFCIPAAAQDDNPSAIFKLAQAKSLEEAGKLYPDLRNEKSEMWQICHQIAMEARDPKSPNHAILAKPDAPLVIAKMAAGVLAERAALPKYVVAVRSVPSVKSSVNGGWKVDKGEVYLFVRWMTVAEYGNSSVADAFKGQDKSYMVLKIDNDTVIVESFNMQAVPKTAEDEAQAERLYLDEVKEKRRVEKQMEQQPQ